MKTKHSTQQPLDTKAVRDQPLLQTKLLRGCTSTQEEERREE